MSIAAQTPPDDSDTETMYSEFGWTKGQHVNFPLNIYSNSIQTCSHSINRQTYVSLSLFVSQGIVLSSFYMGYITTQIPGAFLAQKYGGKTVFGIGIFGASICTLLTPVTGSSIPALCFVRAVMGVFEGVTFPAEVSPPPCFFSKPNSVLHTNSCFMWIFFVVENMYIFQTHLINLWAPPRERSRLISAAMAGMHCGTIISLPMSGVILTYLGWRSIFYIFGSLGCAWTVLWFYIVRESPQRHSTIHPHELDYLSLALRSGVGFGKKSAEPIPWGAMYRNRGIWALIGAGFCIPFSFYCLLSMLPSFLGSVHEVSTETAGMLAMIPYALIAISTVLGGILADYLIKYSSLSRIAVRRLMVLVSCIPVAIFIFTLGFSTSVGMAVALVSFAMFFYGFYYSGTSPLVLEISGPYSALVCGLFNTVGQVWLRIEIKYNFMSSQYFLDYPYLLNLCYEFPITCRRVYHKFTTFPIFFSPF
jgi:ACS family sodium-dependent inorganic phosphate cotransporter-like MFS transporter 5